MTSPLQSVFRPPVAPSLGVANLGVANLGAAKHSLLAWILDLIESPHTVWQAPLDEIIGRASLF